MFSNSNNVMKRVGGTGVFLMIAGSGVVVGSDNAKGALMLTLSEPGYATQTYTDAATPGTTNFIGTYGTFTATANVAYTDISTPTASAAYIQLQSLDVTNIGAANASNSLTISVSESSPFTFPGTATTLMTLDSALNGTLTPATVGDNVTFLSGATPDPSNTVYTSLQSFNATYSPGTENVRVPEVTAQFVRTASFTLADTLTLSLASGESLNVSGTTSVSVPEPIAGPILTAATALMLCRRSRRSRI